MKTDLTEDLKKINDLLNDVTRRVEERSCDRHSEQVELIELREKYAEAQIEIERLNTGCNVANQENDRIRVEFKKLHDRKNELVDQATEDSIEIGDLKHKLTEDEKSHKRTDRNKSKVLSNAQHALEEFLIWNCTTEQLDSLHDQAEATIRQIKNVLKDS